MKRRGLVLALGVVLVLAGLTAWHRGSAGGDAPNALRPELGLFTTLPILWPEAGGVADLLASPEPPHWARRVLDARYHVTALDTLEPPPGLRNLVVAQPRVLAPPENVALDDWVRGGGRVLLFADPMLTWPSAFPVGDRRRPQDVALLSPILARWGLELRFDEAQAPGDHIGAGGFPVNLAGMLALTGNGHDSTCTLGAGALTADCRIGSGHAVIVADAALLEPGGDENVRRAALSRLLESAFAG